MSCWPGSRRGSEEIGGTAGTCSSSEELLGPDWATRLVCLVALAALLLPESPTVDEDDEEKERSSDGGCNDCLVAMVA